MVKSMCCVTEYSICTVAPKLIAAHLSLYSDVLHIIRIDASLPVHDAMCTGVFIDVAKFRLFEEEALFLEITREVVVALSSKTSVSIHPLLSSQSPTHALDISCSPYKTYNYVKYIKILLRLLKDAR
jgi:hypothetical protein